MTTKVSELVGERMKVEKDGKRRAKIDRDDR